MHQHQLHQHCHHLHRQFPYKFMTTTARMNEHNHLPTNKQTSQQSANVIYILTFKPRQRRKNSTKTEDGYKNGKRSLKLHISVNVNMLKQNKVQGRKKKNIQNMQVKILVKI